MRTVRKGIDEQIVEGFDWSDHLLGDTITDSVWSVAAGLTGENATYDDSNTEIEILGGTQNETYKVQNEITTSSGLVYQKSFKVQVVER